ncbi:hexose kinase [Pisciglobus halotolerans]|uniref:Tagatose-6-phosphate kinase n=1 Tax=Pisciglobus halotolerans TaxID=745365 RepID=A0A1I3D017_9LACT|nr:hexose kinase [Pisciglobus halotolerans]SFH79976.1 tagatose 6-phosphate kinase [Pisciglobus halotolerans]
MILTVTMNPSVDISYPIKDFKLDAVNRCKETSKTAGGKGLNVSRVIHLMEEDLLATGIVGGFLGRFIQQELDETQIAHHFYEIEEESRNCIAILHEGMQTEILESGPTITTAQEKAFLNTFHSLLDGVDVVTISGSLPNGIDPLFYNRLLDECYEKNIPVLLDSSGSYLKEALNHPHKPYLIKPNLDELKQLTYQEGNQLSTLDLIEVLEHPLFEDIPVIVVSMGKDGAFVKWQEHYYKVDIPPIPVANPVGSGDATIAGLAVAIKHHQSPLDTLKTAMTTGMLNTMEEKTGYIDKTKFNHYFNQVYIEEINKKDRGSIYDKFVSK